MKRDEAMQKIRDMQASLASLDCAISQEIEEHLSEDEVVLINEFFSFVDTLK